MEVRLDGRVLEQLTAREFELLRELLSSPGRVFTREILLAKLWGYDFFGDERVVDSHIKNLRKKLGVDYIETVRGWATVCRRNIRESLTARIFLLTPAAAAGGGGTHLRTDCLGHPHHLCVRGRRPAPGAGERAHRPAGPNQAGRRRAHPGCICPGERSGGIPGEPRRGECGHGLPLCVRPSPTAVQESDSVSTYTYGADGGRAQGKGPGTM